MRGPRPRPHACLPSFPARPTWARRGHRAARARHPTAPRPPTLLGDAWLPPPAGAQARQVQVALRWAEGTYSSCRRLVAVSHTRSRPSGPEKASKRRSLGEKAHGVPATKRLGAKATSSPASPHVVAPAEAPAAAMALAPGPAPSAPSRPAAEEGGEAHGSHVFASPHRASAVPSPAPQGMTD